MSRRARLVCTEILVCFCISLGASGNGLYQVDLTGVWQFKTDMNNVGLSQGWYKDAGNLRWDSLTVPGNWDAQNEYATYAGVAWYTKRFVADAKWSKEHVRIFFESVYNNATVWLNGKKVGENALGFLPFYFDIDSCLHFGMENQLVVRVDNSFKRGAIWNWGGIRRPVWLELSGKVRINRQWVRAAPDLIKQKALLNIDFSIQRFDLLNSNDVSYKVVIADTLGVKKIIKGTLNGRAQNTDTLNEKVEVSFKITLEQLWDFDHPHLFTSTLFIYVNGHLTDSLRSRFGIRKIEIKNNRFYLNGLPIRTVGFNLVPEDRVTGNTLPLGRIKADVDLMKSLGANMARLSHQNLPEAFLNYLDEKGMLIFDEVGLWGKDEMVDPDHPLPKEWLRKMIYYHYNHPSIIGWCVGNEIGYISMNPKVNAYVKGAVEMAKRLDPGRLAVYVSNSAHLQEADAAQYSDIILLNRYSNWGKDAEKAHVYNPGKPIFISEYGSKITSEDPNLGIIDVDEMLTPLKDKEYVIGASYWTFNDYRSSYSGTSVSGNRSWGIVNAFRLPKRAFQSFKRAYSPLGIFNFFKNDSVLLAPRASTDIPSYALKDYRLVWEAEDRKGQIIDGGFTRLPFMNPGDGLMTIPLKWNISLDSAMKLRVTLVSPQGYSSDIQERFLKLPGTPLIKELISSPRAVQVFFDQSADAISWKAVYTDGTVVKETQPTINGCITIDSLSATKQYAIGIIAINAMGESMPAWTRQIRPDINELPPVVLYTQPARNGWYVGYTSDPKDYLYQVQFRKQGDVFEEGKMRQFSLKGVAKVDNIPSGAYYFRMRRVMEWGLPSQWTKEQLIKTGEENQLLPVVIKGMLHDDRGNLILIIDPPRNAIGYTMRYTNKKTGQAHISQYNVSIVNYLALDPDMNTADYLIEIATVYENGCTAFVQVSR